MGAPRIIDRPLPGFWMVKLVRGGPETPACIVWHQTRFEPDVPSNRMDRSRFLSAHIAGDVVSLDEVWLRRGRPIDEKEYRFALANAQWAKTYSPAEPSANPKAAIDLLTVQLPF